MDSDNILHSALHPDDVSPDVTLAETRPAHDISLRSLLRTKLQRPALPINTVDRPRLIGSLKLVSDLPLTLISAPVGFGKTTLVAQSLAHLATPVAWLSLDEYDNDLQIFLEYLIAAVHSQFPDACSQTQRLLHDFQPPSPERLAASFLNEVQAIASPLILVLDDFHYLTDAGIRQFFATFLRALPANLHLVVITQADPPWPLARLATRGQLQEVRAADLSFRLDEAQAFLETVTGVSLPAPAVATLFTQTEGWIAVLRLATMAFRGEPNLNKAVTRLASQDHLLAGRFLTREVLAHRSPEIRDFLLRTAIVDRMSAPLCMALMRSLTPSDPETPSAQTISEWLCDTNLFIVPLDAEGQWYRYHQLFRELLRNELAAQWDSESIADLHRQASDWYAEHGFIGDAVRHALAAGDTCRAADIVQAQTHARLNREEGRGLDRWLALLPEDLIRQRPALLLAQAWVAAIQFDRHSVSTLLTVVEAMVADAHLPLTEEERGAARAELAVLKCYVLWWGDGVREGCLELAAEAWANLPRDYAYARGVAVYHMGVALYAAGRGPEATQLLWQVVDTHDEPATVKMRALLALVAIYWMAGPSRELERTLRLLARAADDSLPLSKMWATYGLASLHYERNELDQAVEQFKLVTENPYPGNFLCVRDSLIELALAYEAQGRTHDAETTVRDLMERCQTVGRVEEAASASLQVRLALARQDVDEALRGATQLPGDLPIWKTVETEIPAITRAQALLAAGRAGERQQALKLLAALEAAAVDTHTQRVLVRILALQAVGLTAAQRYGEGLAKLERAVRLAEPMDLIRTFVDVGPALAPLLQTLRECDVTPAYLKRVLAAFPAETPLPRVRAHDEELVEPLTNREIEILLLLAQRLSNKEIAEKLFISPLTVKRHTSRLIGKLGVTNRREAVQRARALGLLPPH